MVLFMIPTAIVLSQCIGVGGCGCPSSNRINLTIFVFWAFRNNAPNSALAADAATNFNIMQRAWIAPFKNIDCPFFGIEPRK